MKIVLLLTGKTTDKQIAEGIGNYSARISRYSPFEIIALKDLRNTRNMPVREQKEKEGDLILNSVSSNDYIILLDERGKEFTTIELADWLESLFILPKKRIVFVTGGAWGFSDQVYGRADVLLSMSKLTFSHQLVRLLFAEQLYRVLSIIKGDPYHHDEAVKHRQ
jgi:23S rRNA (pseudouridine1915-N3)-methyltransferase